MARPDYPRRFRVGRGRDRLILQATPGELLLQFADGVTDARIRQLVGTYFGPGAAATLPANRDLAESERLTVEKGRSMASEEGSPHREPAPPDTREERLRSRSMRMIVVPDLVELRRHVRALLEDAGDECLLASPVYRPWFDRRPAGAIAPIPSTVVVSLRPTRSRPVIDKIEDLGITHGGGWAEGRGSIEYFQLLGGIPDDGFDLLPRIRAVPGVRSAELDWTALDPLLGTGATVPWNLHEPRFEQAWGETAGGDGDVVIAVIDTGFDIHHPALDGAWTDQAIWACFPESETPPGCVDIPPNTSPSNPASPRSDWRWHGTAVAGIIAGRPGPKITGAAPECRLLPIRVTVLSDAAIAAALRYAVSRGARVANISLRSGTPHSSLSAAMRAARRAGMLVCASSGNGARGDRPRVCYPAALRGVMAVGASVPDGDRKTATETDEPWFGQYGPHLSVMAPGVDIETTDVRDPGGYIDRKNDDDTGNYVPDFHGTSASAPHVAGLAALLFSMLSPEERLAPGVDVVIRDVIERTCDPTPNLGRYPFRTRGKPRSVARGYGRIDAAAAVAAVAAIA